MIAASAQRTTNCVSNNNLQALVGDDVKQFERRTGWARFALLPLAYGRGRRVQVMGEHWLAEVQGLTQTLNVLGTELAHRWRTNSVELTHGHLFDCASIVQRSQVTAQGFNKFARHNAPPIKRLLAMLLPTLWPIALEIPCRYIAMLFSRPACCSPCRFSGTHTRIPNSAQHGPITGCGSHRSYPRLGGLSASCRGRLPNLHQPAHFPFRGLPCTEPHRIASRPPATAQRPFASIRTYKLTH